MATIQSLRQFKNLGLQGSKSFYYLASRWRTHRTDIAQRIANCTEGQIAEDASLYERLTTLQPRSGPQADRLVWQAMTYLAYDELLTKLTCLDVSAATDANPAKLLQMVTDIPPIMPARCNCQPTKFIHHWQHQHHGDINFVVWQVLNEHNAFGSLRAFEGKKIKSRATKQAKQIEALSSLITPRPDKIWFAASPKR